MIINKKNDLSKYVSTISQNKTFLYLYILLKKKVLTSKNIKVVSRNNTGLTILKLLKLGIIREEKENLAFKYSNKLNLSNYHFIQVRFFILTPEYEKILKNKYLLDMIELLTPSYFKTEILNELEIEQRNKKLKYEKERQYYNILKIKNPRNLQPFERDFIINFENKK